MTVVVQNQPSVWAWLGPVLVLAGAVIAFIGAMITLWVTNRRADKREWNKWRRDTLIKLCSDAASAAQEADTACQAVLDQKTLVFVQAILNTASKAAARIGTISEQLYLMNANYLADRCAEMRAAAEAIKTPASALRASRMNAARQEEQELKNYYADHPSWFAKDSPALQQNMKDTGEIRQRIYEQMLAQPEAEYNDVRDQLEAIRLKFLELGRIELKSAS